MIRMTRITDYAIVVLQQFAARPRSTQLSARDLSTSTHLPLPTVSKVLKLLTRKGFLASHRGASGGYDLAKNPTDISVAEIIGALEGPIGVTECSVDHGSCDKESTCNVRPHWQIINHAIADALAGVSLSRIAGTPPRVEMPVYTGR
jgi:FeS assembly SUF system regulator